MKERLTLAVSWWCFVHASLLGLAALLTAANFLGADINEAMSALAPIEFYFDLFPADALIFGFPFIGWIGLWIVTGSPRILPWRKPEQAGDQ
tara:strand:+ start:1058 stop:1333 length:276 start_codon:yes stop_codon:yes gene_type:complete